MKTKEQKRLEAEVRQEQSTFVSPETPCCKCKRYSKKQCHIIEEMPIFVGRKESCPVAVRR